ncbi:MAG TPA: hypothetical protein VI911_08675 [Patescibacteria group bacterium]|nr:MAG: hypothetical protein UR43_C0005G0097 [candidate division TM6 bacterium GW2011_GWF2_33_332]HLD91070.1 hypothetical protein [Patescibacteria group bacterium]
MSSYTDSMIIFIRELKDKGNTWDEIAVKFNKKFGEEERKTANALRKIYSRYSDIDFTDETVINSIQSNETSKKKSSILAKENRALVNYVSGRKNLLEEIREMLSSRSFTQYKVPIYKPDKSKRNMTMETLLSDLHDGKRTPTFNNRILKERLQKYTSVIIGEINRYEKIYNVERIVAPILGDLIENSYMHGIESLAGCEYQNPEQIRHVTQLLFQDFLIPLSLTGRQIVVPCLTGNHSKYSFKDTYIDPGKNNLSWIIYNMLEMLCKASKLTNIEFIIPEGIYCVYEIYGDPILYEHKVDSYQQKNVEAHIHDRSKQVKKMIKFARFGHFHESLSYGRGRIIFNASFSGLDSYSEIKGYSSEPSQTINYYIETDTRCDSYYHSFIVNLNKYEKV